jgi:histidinol dehydrogenase
MNAIPAQVAGVRSLAICTPAPEGVLNPHVLVVADMLGLEEIYRIGGAQAVGALAYGTATIPRVDKIVGPGNIYVATAKKMVFGEVDIDMIAGPSEILILADAAADPRHIAADLLSQAEHDELATCVLVTDSQKLADRVRVEVESRVDALPRPDIARAALRGQGLIMVVRDLQQGMQVANAVAPEHFELLVREPLQFLPLIRNAGSVFLGAHTPEALGDYLAGPNHVLPTGGSARFFSTLGTPDFQKRSNIMSFSEQQFEAMADKVVRFARSKASRHARSVLVRRERHEGREFLPPSSGVCAPTGRGRGGLIKLDASRPARRPRGSWRASGPPRRPSNSTATRTRRPRRCDACSPIAAAGQRRASCSATARTI